MSAETESELESSAMALGRKLAKELNAIAPFETFALRRRRRD
jgi:hypothetical protein